MPTRRSMWDRLGEGTVDVLVIGGGITGAGIARDAALRGLSVALVEMRDLAFGTSSRSTKLVHGGLRYLEQGDVPLVFESVTERQVLSEMAPHLVRPLGFVFPVLEGAKRSLAIVDMGIWIYDALSLFRSPKLHRKLPQDELSKELPALRVDGIEGAILYYDCATDDARLTLTVALDAAAHGATVATWSKATGLLRDEGGAVVGARVRCERTGAEKDVRAKAVVNASGAWTDRTLTMAGRHGAAMLRPTKGVHIVIDSFKLPLERAILLQHPVDARVMFAIPWGDRTYVGTTDTDADADPSELRATGPDVDYILAVCAHYFPKHPLTRDDVIATWAGLRPLLAPPSEGEHLSESQVSREHHLFVDRDGLITIAGGKLTTFRIMAMQTVDAVERRIHAKRTRKLRKEKLTRAQLPGACDIADAVVRAHEVERAQVASGGLLGKETIDFLIDVYGTLAAQVAGLVGRDPSLAEPLAPGRPEILAQVVYAAESELACTVEDVLARRTQVFFRAHDQGASVARKVAAKLGEIFGYDAAEQERQVAAYQHELELSQAFRRE